MLYKPYIVIIQHPSRHMQLCTIDILPSHPWWAESYDMQQLAVIDNDHTWMLDLR